MCDDVTSQGGATGTKRRLQRKRLSFALFPQPSTTRPASAEESSVLPSASGALAKDRAGLVSSLGRRAGRAGASGPLQSLETLEMPRCWCPPARGWKRCKPLPLQQLQRARWIGPSSSDEARLPPSGVEQLCGGRWP